ncbi:MAG: hypothetical protein J6Q48_02925 [Bacteroidaceae bacterium]|nr:hypothetical protein [Bacteroidaceae bacterium]
MNSLRHGKFPRIKDVIPMTNGVFSHCDYVFPEYLALDKSQLDYLFMSSYGMKNPAPVIDLLHDEDADEDYFSQLTSEELDKLAALMVGYYKNKWDKLAEIYEVEYDPIHNYLDEWEDVNDGTLNGSEVTDSDRTDTYNYGVSHNNTRTDNLAEVEQHNLGNSNERTFENYKEKTDYHSATDHVIDANNPMKTEVEYGKDDLRVDNLTRKNSGEESTINNGSSTHAVWGFNSGNSVNSDMDTDTNKTSRHVIGNQQGGNLLEENDTGWQRHTLSGKDTTTNTGKNSDEKSGYDELSKSGKIKDAGTDTGVLTTNNTGTQTNIGSDSTTGTNSRALDSTVTKSDADHRARSGRHSGNIGNLTSQQMLKEEIELWKWNFIRTVLEDARDFLTLEVYL